MRNCSATPRIVYMGTPEFAVAPLRALLQQGHNVVCVVTVPDRPAGRGQKMRASAVKEFAIAEGLPLLQPGSMADPHFLASLRAYSPDVGIVVAFRKLPLAVYTVPGVACFNLHASLLPRYRGAAPINWALINGERESGVTTFLLNERIDGGEILLQRAVPIGENTTAGELHDALAQVGARLVLQSVEGLCAGTLTPVAQPLGGELPNAPKIFRADCRLDFACRAQALHNRCRGLSPYPGAWCEMRVGSREYQEVKLFDTACPGEGSGEPEAHLAGQCRVIERGEALAIHCGDGGELRVGSIQPAGRRRMSVSDFLRGCGTMELWFR